MTELGRCSCAVTQSGRWNLGHRTASAEGPSTDFANTLIFISAYTLKDPPPYGYLEEFPTGKRRLIHCFGSSILQTLSASRLHNIKPSKKTATRKIVLSRASREVKGPLEAAALGARASGASEAVWKPLDGTKGATWLSVSEL